jgi:hypothetical protein
MSLGEILDGGFWLLRDHARVLVGAAAVLHVPMALLLAVWPLRYVSTASIALVFPLIHAAVTWAVAELYLGRPASVAEALRTVWSLLLPLIGTTLRFWLFLTIAGAIIGFAAVITGMAVGRFGAAAVALVILPAFVYLGLAFALLPPVMVLERSFGRRAFERSRDLLRGSGARALGAYLAGSVLVVVLSGVVQMALGRVPVLGPIGVGVTRAVGVAYTSAVFVLLYFDVRCRKEAFDLEHLAQLVASEPPAVPALA